MANSVMEELGYLALGAGLVELTDYLATEYADKQAGMNFPSLGKAAKPSVYLPAVEGIGGLGYALYQANKNKRLKDEELVLAGAGIYGTIKTVRKLLAPQVMIPPIPASTRNIQGRTLNLNPSTMIRARATEGYLKAPGGMGGPI